MERVWYIFLLGALLFRTWAAGRAVAGPVPGMAGPFLVAIAMQLLLGRDFILTTGGMSWLLWFIYAFAFGYEAMVWKGGACDVPRGETIIVFRKDRASWGALLAWAGCVCAGLFVALTLYNIKILGYGVLGDGTFFREDYLARASAGGMGVVHRGLQLGVYLSVIPIYLYGAVLGRPVRWMMVAFATAATAQGFLTVSKMGILLVVLVWIGVWTAHRQKRSSDINLKLIGVVLGGGVAVAAVMIAIMFVRYGLSELPKAWFYRKLLVFVAGSPSAWCVDFATSDVARQDWSLGATFRGPLELLGAAKRQIGIYPTVRIDAGFVGSISNVYTGFKMLVADFGRSGALCVMFSWGVACGALDARIARRPSIEAICLQAVALTTVYWMSVTLMTYYNVLIFMLLEILVIGQVYFVETGRGARDSGSAGLQPRRSSFTDDGTCEVET